MQWVLWWTTYYSFTRMCEHNFFFLLVHLLHLCITRNKLKSDTVTLSKKTKEGSQEKKKCWKGIIKEMGFGAMIFNHFPIQPRLSELHLSKNFTEWAGSVFYHEMGQKNININWSKLFWSIKSNFSNKSKTKKKKRKKSFPHNICKPPAIYLEFFHFGSTGIIPEEIWFLQKKVNKWKTIIYNILQIFPWRLFVVQHSENILQVNTQVPQKRFSCLINQPANWID